MTAAAGAVAVVPAAGRSQRMGRPKALLAYRGSTLVEILARSLLEGGVSTVRLVVAPGAELPATLETLAGVEVSENPRPERGMLSSVLTGIAAAGGAAELERRQSPLVVCPVDYPAVSAATVRALLDAVGEGARIALPVRRGRRGHPIAIGASLVAQVAGLDPEVGLRQILVRQAAEIVEIESDDPGVLLNVNTPEEYQELLDGWDRSPG